MKGKAYLSGKISGLPREEVVMKFRDAEQKLTSEGWEIVSPIDNGLPVESSWGEHLGKDLEMLATCEAIILLPCWTDSIGAKLEKHYASLRGMKILQYNEPN